MPSTWVCSNSRLGAFALFAACVVSAAHVRAADGVTLSVKKGPAAGDLTLDWTGGQPTFDVYRATTASGLVTPGHLVTSTSERTLTAGEGVDAISFFIIASPCVIDPPERCDGVDNDCNGTIDDPGAESSCALADATAACVAGACAVDFCDGGYANCDTTAVNGCEFATSDFDTDPSNCGGCGIACPASPNASATCSGSLCGIACNSGFASCDGDSGNGCECAGTICCFGACAPVHVNGLGQSFDDCAAQGVPGSPATYTRVMAVGARAAWPFGGTDADAICGGGATVTAVYRQTAATCAVWQFGKTTAGHVNLNTANNTCFCPSTTDPVWY